MSILGSECWDMNISLTTAMVLCMGIRYSSQTGLCQRNMEIKKSKRKRTRGNWRFVMISSIFVRANVMLKVRAVMVKAVPGMTSSI